LIYGHSPLAITLSTIFEAATATIPMVGTFATPGRGKYYVEPDEVIE
jgi:hypothetical protein